MKAHLFLLLATCACLAADTPKEDKSKADLKELQGDWKVDSIEADGQDVSQDLFNDILRDVVVRVNKEKISLVQGGSTDIVSAEMTLEADAKPKSADFKPDKDIFGVFNGQSMWGIYELKGSEPADREFKICVSIRTAVKQRPTEFKTQPDSGLYLVVLKRP
jgi:uncharacterized protein (TIGR03067 family)